MAPEFYRPVGAQPDCGAFSSGGTKRSATDYLLPRLRRWLIDSYGLKTHLLPFADEFSERAFENEDIITRGDRYIVKE